ncbi:MAG: glycosyltransferase family 39 protein [bacterium]|nr:glycosyltransferase family 39 protein [bacterium]
MSKAFMKSFTPSLLRWGLFLIALSARVVYVLQGYEVPPQDTLDYDEIALNLLRGDGFVARENWFGFELRSWRAPFYPFFLALVYGVFGYRHLAVQLVQCVVGALTCLWVQKLGDRLGPRLGLLSGAVAAFYGPLVAVCSEVMTETWFIFWLVLGAWALVREKGVGGWLGGGAAIGMAGLTRPVGLVFLAALVLVALVKRSRHLWMRAFWAGLAAGVVLFPWTVRNYQVHGVWPILSTHSGFILARSNGANPDWRQAAGWGIERQVFEQTPSEIERDRIWFGQGLSSILNHPQRYARWVLERFLRFWYFFRPEYHVWFMTLLPFFVGGFYRFWKTEDFLLLSGFIGISLAVFSFFLYGAARFRLPLEPFFIVFAASWIWFLIDYKGLWSTCLWVGGVAGVNLLVYWQDVVLRAMLLDFLHAFQLK